VQAELALYKRRFEKLTELRRLGQAHSEELERARADLQVAEGKLLADEEERQLLRLQWEKAKTQLERRTITAPMDGTVTDIHRLVGEYVSSGNPKIITLVELTTLKANFLATRQQAARFRAEQEVKVRWGEGEKPITGFVEYVAEVTQAESGLITVRVRFDNQDRKIRSGERCRLVMP
jgi:multidrug resistance efflux pump